MCHTAPVICPDARGQNAIRNAWRIMSWPWSYLIFFFFIIFFQKDWRIFFGSNQSEAARSWKLRSVCTQCCNLEHFLLCSTLKPFSEAAAGVFKSFCAVCSLARSIHWRWRYYLAPQSLCVFVGQTNVQCVFVAALCMRDREPRCPGRVRLQTGFTSLLTKQGGIFSGLLSLFMSSI